MPRRSLLTLLAAIFSVTAFSGYALAEKTTLSQRLENYKASTKASVGMAEEPAILKKCFSAQSAIKGQYDKLTRVIVLRNQTYSQQSAILDNLIDFHKKKGRNTKNLETMTAEFKALIDAYKAKQDTFAETMLDAQNVNCTSDPKGFKATILSLKAAQKEVANGSQALKDFSNSKLSDVLAEAGKLGMN